MQNSTEQNAGNQGVQNTRLYIELKANSKHKHTLVTNTTDSKHRGDQTDSRQCSSTESSHRSLRAHSHSLIQNFLGLSYNILAC